jgi:hypothetical protein
VAPPSADAAAQRALQCFAAFVSFAQPVRVSEGAPCNDTPRNAGVIKRFEYGGDYFGLAADRDGVFHLIWSDSRNGVYQLWSASITVARTED